MAYPAVPCHPLDRAAQGQPFKGILRWAGGEVRLDVGKHSGRTNQRPSFTHLLSVAIGPLVERSIVNDSYIYNISIYSVYIYIYIYYIYIYTYLGKL